MNNLLRAIVVLAGMAVLFAVWVVFSDVIVDMQAASLAAETTRYVAAQQTERVQSQEWNTTVRSLGDSAATILAWSAAAVAVMVLSIQAGRTLRHQESERTRRTALLAAYIDRFLPDANAEVCAWRGQPAIMDHDSGEIIPYSVAQLEMSQARRLTG